MFPDGGHYRGVPLYLQVSQCLYSLLTQYIPASCEAQCVSSCPHVPVSRCPCRRCKPHPLHRGISSGTRQPLRSKLRNPSAWIPVSARIETYCKSEIRISLFPSTLLDFFPSLRSLARSLPPSLSPLPPSLLSSPSLPPSLPSTHRRNALSPPMTKLSSRSETK